MESNVAMETLDVTKLKVPELKKELKARGLTIGGNKQDLIERLQSAMKTKSDDNVSARSGEDLDEDLLDEDDDEHDEFDSALNELDSPVETTPKPLKRKLSESQPEIKQPKKIVLNRSISSTEEQVENESPSEIKPDDKVEISGEEKKVIKLSELSAKERLEMRAKKFGVTLTGDAKKVARAERFGAGGINTTKSSGSVAIAPAAAPTVDVLKQRAERFGVSVSTTLTKLENQVRMEKRKERFGGVAAAATNGAAKTTTIDKAQQRLERFKQPVK